MPTPRPLAFLRHHPSPLLLCALGVAACADDRARATLGPPTPLAAVADRRPWRPPAEPTVFAPGVISTEKEEWRMTFTPDGDTAYFGRSDGFFPQTRQATILVSHRVRGGWSPPVPAPFSGEFSDIDPFITPDGRRLFFSSIRPVGGQPRADIDLWVVERTRGGAWGEPVHLGAAVNSPSDELYPSVSRDGTLYFGSDRPGGVGGWDIYRARRRRGAYGAAENVGTGVNTANWEFNPTVSPDGRTMLFASLWRPNGYGYGDIYVSRFRRGEWSGAANLGPLVNTAADEYHPSFSPDRRTLYFVRHSYEPWVPGDLYEVRVGR